MLEMVHSMAQKLMLKLRIALGDFISWELSNLTLIFLKDSIFSINLARQEWRLKMRNKKIMYNKILKILLRNKSIPCLKNLKLDLKDLL